jgi:hypothetical protein
VRHSHSKAYCPPAKRRRLALDGAPVHGRDTAEQAPCSRECARVLTDCQLVSFSFSTTVPDRGSPPAVLLRESYREGGQVKNRTVANLSSWPEAKVEAPVHSFATLLEDLATIAVNRIQPAGGLPAFTVITTSTQSSARPSISSAFPAALGTRSQAASDHRAFPQADALPRYTQGNIGLAIAWPT